MNPDKSHDSFPDQGEEQRREKSYVETEGKKVYGSPVQDTDTVKYNYWMDFSLTDGTQVKCIRGYAVRQPGIDSGGAIDSYQFIYTDDGMVVYSDVTGGNPGFETKRNMEEKLASIRSQQQ